jgi:hypothetical protein
VIPPGNKAQADRLEARTADTKRLIGRQPTAEQQKARTKKLIDQGAAWNQRRIDRLTDQQLRRKGLKAGGAVRAVKPKLSSNGADSAIQQAVASINGTIGQLMGDNQKLTAFVTQLGQGLGKLAQAHNAAQGRTLALARANEQIPFWNPNMEGVG